MNNLTARVCTFLNGRSRSIPRFARSIMNGMAELLHIVSKRQSLPASGTAADSNFRRQRKKKWEMNMARGVRKSPKEKLTEKLNSVEEAIAQYSQCLEQLKNEKKELEAEMEQLEIAELSAMMKEKNLSVNELRNMVEQAAV